MLSKHSNTVQAIKLSVFTNNMELAKKILERYSKVESRGTRIGGWREYKVPPKNQSERDERKRIENLSYVRIQDDALYAVLKITESKGIKWEFKTKILRRFTNKEFSVVNSFLNIN